MGDIDVEMEGVTKKYGKVIAVKDLTVGVRSKEMFFLLGPSGCGKTTAMRLIAGLERPDKGIIKIKGKDMDGVPPHKRNLAIVFQSWSLWPHKTVYGNIEFGLRMGGIPKEERRNKVGHALGFMKLTELANRYPSELSGGEQQRVALARALVVEPEVLLLDEPVTNLDLNLRKKMLLEMKRLQSELGVTTIYVTHDQTEALSMADRIALMKDGTIVETNTPINLYENPKNQFTTEFIGEVNLLRGVVSKVYGLEAIVTTKEGMTLSILSEAGFSEGDELNVFIRPERLIIHKNRVDTINTFPAEIKNVIYLGSTMRYIAQFESGAEISYEGKNIGKKEFGVGEKVCIELKPDELICTRLK